MKTTTNVFDLLIIIRYCTVLIPSPEVRKPGVLSEFWCAVVKWEKGARRSRAAKGKRKWGERRDSFLTPFSHFTNARQTPIFGLLVKEGAVLQSSLDHRH